MAKVVFPPSSYRPTPFEVKPTIFLAGTIEMGNSIDWQEEAIKMFFSNASVIYNPRRQDWDSSWQQSIDNPQFNAQVNWELQHIEDADYVFFNFEASSKSPISLLELGIAAARKPQKTVVCCPKEFWRFGNVEVVCNRYDVRIVNDFEEATRVLNLLIRGI